MSRHASARFPFVCPVSGCATCRERALVCDLGLDKCTYCWKKKLACDYSVPVSPAKRKRNAPPPHEEQQQKKRQRLVRGLRPRLPSPDEELVDEPEGIQATADEQGGSGSEDTEDLQHIEVLRDDITGLNKPSPAPRAATPEVSALSSARTALRAPPPEPDASSPFPLPDDIPEHAPSPTLPPLDDPFQVYVSLSADDISTITANGEPADPTFRGITVAPSFASSLIEIAHDTLASGTQRLALHIAAPQLLEATYWRRRNAPQDEAAGAWKEEAVLSFPTNTVSVVFALDDIITIPATPDQPSVLVSDIVTTLQDAIPDWEQSLLTNTQRAAAAEAERAEAERRAAAAERDRRFHERWMAAHPDFRPYGKGYKKQNGKNRVAKPREKVKKASVEEQEITTENTLQGRLAGVGDAEELLAISGRVLRSRKSKK